MEKGLNEYEEYARGVLEKFRESGVPAQRIIDFELMLFLCFTDWIAKHNESLRLPNDEEMGEIFDFALKETLRIFAQQKAEK